MHRSKRFALLAVLLVAAVKASAAEPVDPLRLVDPFVGTSVYDGALYPGAALPYGMVKLSPDTTKPSSGGYNPDEPILGFSHTHIGGTGGGTFDGQIRVRPQSGPLVIDPPPSAKAHETASPGYYAVDLVDGGIHAELTVTSHAGLHRYTFPAGKQARVLVDLAATINNNGDAEPPAGVCTGCQARFVSDREVEGLTHITAGVARIPYSVYFVAVFDRPFVGRGIWLDHTARADADKITGGDKQPAGVYAEFAPGQVVGMRVGISFTSISLARQHLQPIDGVDFDRVREQARARWGDHLARIAVEGGTDAQRRQFYTAMYHTVLAPTDATGDNAGWAADDQTPVFYDIHTLWDTFRSADPLRTLIDPEHERRIVRSLLGIYQKTGWLPDAWAYNHASIPFQGGTHADNVIADAVVKKLGGFDLKLAYAAVRKNATEPNRETNKIFPGPGRVAPYFELGYVPSAVYAGNDANGQTNEWSSGVSRTLEYAYNDFCVSEVAAALGRTEDAARLRAQSLNSFKLFDPEKRLFWGKTAHGDWDPDADAKQVTMGWTNAFDEGSAWQYRFSTPHDMAGLIRRVGGDDAFVSVLDQYFDEKLHWAGNEPGFLTPWLYIYAGRPDKATDRVREILSKDFKVAADGYPGDEDVGAMSAWYIFASIGMFPNAGQDVYLLATPLFSKTTMKLGASGKTLVITASGLSAKNKYVQSATLNGKPLDRAWIRHAEIINGAELVFVMGEKPSAWGTTQPPPSLSTDTAVSPAPL